jgi:hypothetical protein
MDALSETHLEALAEVLMDKSTTNQSGFVEYRYRRENMTLSYYSS